MGRVNGFVVVVIVAIVVALTQSVFADVDITINRQSVGTRCTSGYLLVNGATVAYTLERPPIANIGFISSIPDGNYAANIRTDHPDHWRIELIGVPKRDHVQIHIGNVVDDTVGCILVGKTISRDLCSLGNSAQAYSDLRTAFAMQDGAKVTVTIRSSQVSDPNAGRVR
jgi:hypothetical protein